MAYQDPDDFMADLAADERQRDDQNGDGSDFASTLLPASQFAHSEPHPRQWVADQWLPCGLVTGFFGDGGLGKSLITQQLATCVVTGQPFYGLDVQRGPVMMVTCEDEPNELHWRQKAINRQLGVDMGDLGELVIAPRLGLDSSLVGFKADGGMVQTQLLRDIKQEARLRRVKLLTLDNVMHLYPDNPNDNGRVTRFVAALTGSDFRG
jgi:RecA-family ATPase